MDPISVIIAALAAGAAAAAKETAEKGVKDAYEGLKALIKKRFEGDALGQGLVDAKPEEMNKVEGLLKEKIVEAEVNKDAGIITVAEKLMELLKTEESGAASSKNFTTNIQAEKVASQTGDHNQQSITFS